ncbi:MAG: divergent PAP2 family protein, partial [Oscillospiraceae bacterium]|nr:divergent PAP2 family protein [Oscillospiraceae bacterium]MCI8807208.1 divergent PAP2 family protein [Oscillospiraceae bacterium]MCI9548931.1 divergent PAP2 family protein [Oscillospiraceae bacterium]
MSPVLLIAIAAWAVAQGLKLLIAAAVYRKFDITYLTTGGGMPSSHSALVCAAAVSCGMSAGFDSPVFAVAAVMAFIVMYDAANVRRETGEQAKVLNYILRNWGEVRPEEFEDELKELIGHTPFQVAMGAVLGVAVGLAGSFIAFGV